MVSLRIREAGGYSVDSDMRLNWEDPPRPTKGAAVQDLSKRSLQMIAHHERQHLVESPLTWDQWAQWCLELARAGFGSKELKEKSPEIALMVNIYADLQINAGLAKRFGRRWVDTLREQLAFWPSSDPLQILFRRAHDKQQKTNLAPVPAEGVRLATVKPVADVEKDAELLSKACVKDEDLSHAARIMQPYIQASQQQSGGGLVVIGIDGTGMGQPRDPQEAARRFAAIAEEAGLSPEELARALRGAGLGGYTEVEAEPIYVEAKALRMFRQAVKLIAKVKGREGFNVKVSEPWRVGDDIQRLDVMGTLMTHGVVIPGITTIKRQSFPVDRQVDSGKGARVAILIDESGSIGPMEFERECEAAVGLVALAMERGWEVAAVKFSSQATAMSDKWTRNYLDTMKWFVRRKMSGGTELKPALESIAHLAEDATVAVLTDAAIADLQNARGLIARLAGTGSVFRIFMFGLATVPADVKAAFAGMDVKFFAVPKIDERLAGQVIQEVAG